MDNAMMELALRRAGFGSLEEWREKTGGSAAVADMALMPYLVGYELYRVRAGDTLTKIAGYTVPRWNQSKRRTRMCSRTAGNRANFGGAIGLFRGGRRMCP